MVSGGGRGVRERFVWLGIMVGGGRTASVLVIVCGAWMHRDMECGLGRQGSSFGGGEDGAEIVGICSSVV